MSQPGQPQAPETPHQPVDPDLPFELPPEEGDAPLQLPHERDQDKGMTNPVPDLAMLQAYKDLKRGLVDTDMRATPGAGGQLPRQDEKSVRRD